MHRTVPSAYVPIPVLSSVAASKRTGLRKFLKHDSPLGTWAVHHIHGPYITCMGRTSRTWTVHHVHGPYITRMGRTGGVMYRPCT